MSRAGIISAIGIACYGNPDRVREKLRYATVAEIAGEFDVSLQTVYGWCRQLDVRCGKICRRCKIFFLFEEFPLLASGRRSNNCSCCARVSDEAERARDLRRKRERAQSKKAKKQEAKRQSMLSLPSDPALRALRQPMRISR